jgi:hypothetical protein
MFHSGQLGYMIDVIEHIFDGGRPAGRNKIADHRDADHAAPRRHFPDPFVGFAARTTGNQRTAIGVSDQHRLARSRHRIQCGAISTV